MTTATTTTETPTTAAPATTTTTTTSALDDEALECNVEPFDRPRQSWWIDMVDAARPTRACARRLRLLLLILRVLRAAT